MKKLTLIIGFLLLNFSYASALICIDLQSNLTKGKESDEVLTLQNFLADKGFLTARPNGYFGNGTFSAVKKYQKSVNLSQSGGVMALTRAAIKKKTCINNSLSIDSLVATTSTVNPKITATTSIFSVGCNSLEGFSVVTGAKCVIISTLPEGCASVNGFSVVTGLSCASGVVATSSSVVAVVKQTTPNVVASFTSNEKRQQDVKDLLGAMYAYYIDSRGMFPIPYISTSSLEICTLGISQCDDFNEIKSSLVPKFLSRIPTDPSVATTSIGSGYFMARYSNGDITITAPKADSKVNVFATCNFNSDCKIKTASDISLVKGVPRIDSIDKAIFLSSGNMSIPLTIHGSEFGSSSNTVTLSLQGGRKIYTLGSFDSADGVTIKATSSFTNTKLPCGVGCLELPQAGTYDVMVKTQSGESNTMSILLQGLTTTSNSNGSDVSFRPKSTHIKLGTVTLSSPSVVTLSALEFTLTGTTTLVSKVSNFTITDAVTGKIINSGPKFVIPSEVLSDYKTKIYELYADIAEIENSYAGRIDISGFFTVKESISNSLVSVPFPSFLITISY